MPALSAYGACMESLQYTIRGIPAFLDQAIRLRAKEEGKSLNTVAREALERGLELDATLMKHTDLDDLIGSWQEDPAFDAAIAEFGKVDEEVWK